MMKKALCGAVLLLALALALAMGCAAAPQPPAAQPSSPPLSALPAPEPAPAAPAPESRPPEGYPRADAIPLVNDYIAGEADRVLATIITPEMTRYRQVQAVYRWLVENTWFFNEPVGLESWQWRGDPRQVPGYVENRAISPLVFDLGSCEDYASAGVILLRRLGLRAEYVAGLTISVQGSFVDHAWLVVELDGSWYHLDPQLEDNVTRQNRLTYRYFLKSDSTLLADHRWGENLIAYYGGSMSESRRKNVRENWSVPECPSGLAAPEPEELTPSPKPDRAKLAAQIEAEKADYQAKHGPLPSTGTDTTPPVL